jgi:GTP-binding protein
VVFSVRRNLRTLAHLRYQQRFRAENGRDGEGRERSGRAGTDVVVAVPPGTVIRDADTGELIRDFGQDREDFRFLKGGNGGWGNVHFKSAVNQAPRKALPGRPGTRRRLQVELRVLADIGLVGLPNAGKSSLLDAYTNARPRIAPYPFTTKIPNLGVLSFGAPGAAPDGDGRDIIIADIPGLIEGASRGLGLGIRFLKHISRTAVLAFLVDLGDDTYLRAFDVLYGELAAFSPELTAKRRVLVGTKLDLAHTPERLAELAEKYPGEQVLGISVFSGQGLPELGVVFGELVRTAEAAAGPDEDGPWEDEAP